MTGLAASEPRLFKTDESAQGHILLVAENGEAEAVALARTGYDCALSHARTMEELKVDEAWAREQVLTRCFWDPAYGRTYESSLFAGMLLALLGLAGTRYRRSPNWDVRNLRAKVDTVIWTQRSQQSGTPKSVVPSCFWGRKGQYSWASRSEAS